MKNYVTFGLVLVAFVLAIAGLPVGYVKYPISGKTASVGVFINCLDGRSECTEAGAVSCDERNDATKATKAFEIIMIIACFAAAVMLGVRAFGSLAAAVLIDAALKPVLYVLHAVTLVSGFLVWALLFTLFDSEYCGSAIKAIAGSEAGAAGPLFFVSWVLALAGLIAECVMAGAIPDVSSATSPDADTKKVDADTKADA